MSHQVGSEELVEGCQRGSCYHGIASKSSDMSHFRTICQQLHTLIRRHECPYRHTACHPLAYCDNIGGKAIVLETKELARAPETWLYLINNKERAYFFTTAFYLDEIVVLGFDKASSSLDAFEHYPCGTFGDFEDIGFVVELYKIDIRDKRTISAFAFFIAH